MMEEDESSEMAINTDQPLPFWKRVNKEIDRVSLKLDDEINARGLIDVPEKQWKLFVYAVNAHLVLASVLFITGCVCFCLGMQFSLMYDAVNCSDGTNVFPPLLNLMAAFTGLFAVRTQHMKWPAFVHLLSLIVALPMNLITAIDLTVNSFHWSNYWSKTLWYKHEEKVLENIDGWRDWTPTYQALDLTLAVFAVLNEVAACLLIAIYRKYWCIPRRYQIPSDRPPVAVTEVPHLD